MIEKSFSGIPGNLGNAIAHLICTDNTKCLYRHNYFLSYFLTCIWGGTILLLYLDQHGIPLSMTGTDAADADPSAPPPEFIGQSHDNPRTSCTGRMQS